MGAWGVHTFEDDTTMDWLDELFEGEEPLEFLAESLDLDGVDELEYEECAAVLAASAIIDGLLNGPNDDLPEEAVEWIEEHHELDVQPLAAGAVAGLTRFFEDSSELNNLWSENEDLYPEWRARIEALAKRLERNQ